MRPPTRAEMCRWVKTAWDTCLTTEGIARSFITCGINATDGSQDADISCFKPGREADGGLRALQTSHEALQRNLLEDSVDPFQEVTAEDPKELETNEIVVDNEDDDVNV